MNFLILRSGATYRGRTAIKVMSGECGNMYFCMGSAETGHDAALMVSIVHSVANMAAIVHKPEYVLAQGNLHIDRYYGGLGMKFFNPSTYMHRSSQGNEESIVVCAIPYAERQQNLPNPLDISGRFYTDYESGLVDVKVNDELHYSSAYRYNNLYQFYSATDPTDELTYPSCLPDDTHTNRICWAGAQFMFNRTSGKFDYYETSTGPFGECVYSGVGRVRNGSDQYLDPSRMHGMMQTVM